MADGNNNNLNNGSSNGSLSGATNSTNSQQKVTQQPKLNPIEGQSSVNQNPLAQMFPELDRHLESQLENKYSNANVEGYASDLNWDDFTDKNAIQGTHAGLSSVQQLIDKQAERQGFFEYIGKKAGVFFTTAIPRIASAMGRALDIPDYFNGSLLDSVIGDGEDEVGNWFSNWVDANAIKPVENYLKTYDYTDYGNKLTSPKWWFGKGFDIANSAVEFLGGGFGVAGVLGKGMKVAGMMTGLSKLPTAQKGMETLLQAVAMNQMASVSSAYDTGTQVYKDFIKRGFTDEEARKRASIASASIMNLNRINIALNLTGASLFLKSGLSTRGIAEFTDAALKRQLNREMVQEMGEEVVEFTSEQLGRRAAELDEEYTLADSFTTDRLEEIAKNPAQAIEAAGMGAAGGYGQTKVAQMLNKSETLAQNKYTKAIFGHETYKLDSKGEMIPIKDPNDDTKVIGYEKETVTKHELMRRRWADAEKLMKDYQAITNDKTTDFTSAFMNVQEMNDMISEMNVAREAGDDVKVEKLSKKFLSQQAYRAFQSGTTDSLIGAYRSLANSQFTDEEAEAKGLPKNYKERANQAIKKIEELENEYLISQNYENGARIYETKLNEIDARDQRRMYEKFYDSEKQRVNNSIADAIKNGSVLPSRKIKTQTREGKFNVIREEDLAKKITGDFVEMTLDKEYDFEQHGIDQKDGDDFKTEIAKQFGEEIEQFEHLKKIIKTLSNEESEFRKMNTDLKSSKMQYALSEIRRKMKIAEKESAKEQLDNSKLEKAKNDQTQAKTKKLEEAKTKVENDVKSKTVANETESVADNVQKIEGSSTSTTEAGVETKKLDDKKESKVEKETKPTMPRDVNASVKVPGNKKKTKPQTSVVSQDKIETMAEEGKSLINPPHSESSKENINSVDAETVNTQEVTEDVENRKLRENEELVKKNFGNIANDLKSALDELNRREENPIAATEQDLFDSDIVKMELDKQEIPADSLAVAIIEKNGAFYFQAVLPNNQPISNSLIPLTNDETTMYRLGQDVRAKGLEEIKNRLLANEESFTPSDNEDSKLRQIRLRFVPIIVNEISNAINLGVLRADMTFAEFGKYLMDNLPDSTLFSDERFYPVWKGAFIAAMGTSEAIGTFDEIFNNPIDKDILLQSELQQQRELNEDEPTKITTERVIEKTSEVEEKSTTPKSGFTSTSASNKIATGMVNDFNTVQEIDKFQESLLNRTNEFISEPSIFDPNAFPVGTEILMKMGDSQTPIYYNGVRKTYQRFLAEDLMKASDEVRRQFMIEYAPIEVWAIKDGMPDKKIGFLHGTSWVTEKNLQSLVQGRSEERTAKTLKAEREKLNALRQEIIQSNAGIKSKITYRSTGHFIRQMTSKDLAKRGKNVQGKPLSPTPTAGQESENLAQTSRAIQDKSIRTVVYNGVGLMYGGKSVDTTNVVNYNDLQLGISYKLLPMGDGRLFAAPLFNTIISTQIAESIVRAIDIFKKGTRITADDKKIVDAIRNLTKFDITSGQGISDYINLFLFFQKNSDSKELAETAKDLEGNIDNAEAGRFICTFSKIDGQFRFALGRKKIIGADGKYRSVLSFGKRIGTETHEENKQKFIELVTANNDDIRGGILRVNQALLGTTQAIPVISGNTVLDLNNGRSYDEFVNDNTQTQYHVLNVGTRENPRYAATVSSTYFFDYDNRSPFAQKKEETKGQKKIEESAIKPLFDSTKTYEDEFGNILTFEKEEEGMVHFKNQNNATIILEVIKLDSIMKDGQWKEVQPKIETKVEPKSETKYDDDFFNDGLEINNSPTTESFLEESFTPAKLTEEQRTAIQNESQTIVIKGLDAQRQHDLIDYVAFELNRQSIENETKTAEDQKPITINSVLDSVYQFFNEQKQMGEKTLNEKFLPELPKLIAAKDDVNLQKLKTAIANLENKLAVVNAVLNNREKVVLLTVLRLKKMNGIVVKDNQEIDVNEESEADYEKNQNDDYSSITRDGKNSLSAKVRKFLASIKDSKWGIDPKTNERKFVLLENFFKRTKFVPFDVAYETLSAYLDGVDSTMEAVYARLQEYSDRHAWFLSVIDQLKSASDQVRNEFMVAMCKDRMKMQFVLWNYDGKEGVKNRYNAIVMNSNSVSTATTIQKDWQARFMSSELVESDNGIHFMSNDVIDDWMHEIESIGKMVSEEDNYKKVPSNFVVDLTEAIGTEDLDFDKTIEREIDFDTTQAKGFENNPTMLFVRKGTNAAYEVVKLSKNGQNGNPMYSIKRIVFNDTKTQNQTNKVFEILEKFGIHFSDTAKKELMVNGIKVSKRGYSTIGSWIRTAATTNVQHNNPLSVIYHSLKNLRVEEEQSPISLADNKILDASIFRKLAMFQADYEDVLMSNSVRTGGKTVYGFTMRKYATDRTKELKTNLGLLKNLSELSFSQNSYWLNQLLTKDENGNIVIDEESPMYKNFGLDVLDLQALKEKGKPNSDDASLLDLSPIDHEYIKLAMFTQMTQDSSVREVTFLYPSVPADKSVRFICNAQSIDVEFDSETMISSNTVELFYVNAVVGEINRILKKQQIGELNISGYNNGARLFHFFPRLNTLTEIYNADGSLALDVLSDVTKVSAIKKVISESLMEFAKQKLDTWQEFGFMAIDEEDGKQKPALFNEEYVRHIVNRLPAKIKSDQASINLAMAMDFEFNQMFANINMFQLMVGDPALYYKAALFNPKRGTGTKILTSLMANEIFLQSMGVNPKNEQERNEYIASLEDSDLQARLSGQMDMVEALTLMKDSVMKEAQEIAQSRVSKMNDSQMLYNLSLIDAKLANQLADSLISEIFVNVGKRLAAETAPGQTLANTDDQNEKINYLFLADAEKESLAMDYRRKLNLYGANDYAEIESTDAQEYTTVFEHLKTLYGLGKISKRSYDSLVDKYKRKENFTDSELRTVLQPIKPVYTAQINNEKSISQDVGQRIYVKTASYPLIPQLTQGLQIDQLRQFMEENGYDRAPYMTGVKVGSTKKGLTIWDEDGNFIVPNPEVVAQNHSAIGLPRKGFRLQMEVPYDEEKDAINIGTQERKLLFASIRDVGGFTFNGNQYNGSNLETEYLKRYNQLFQLSYNRLKREIINPNTGSLNIPKLQEILKEEAMARNYSLNEIDALELDENGDFKIPLWLNPASKKFEAMLNSIINNRIIKMKFPGISLVAASETGYNVFYKKGESITDYRNRVDEYIKTNRNGIVFTSAFQGKLYPGGEFWTNEQRNIRYNDAEYEALSSSEKAGLTKQLLPTQTLIPCKFRDKQGNLIDARNFVNEQTGRLDESRIPRNILEFFSFRIPTQGHNSMLWNEIVGFLPVESGDMMICSPDLLPQKGLDFDVDKEYCYFYSTQVKESESNQDRINQLEESIAEFDVPSRQISALKNRQKELESILDKLANSEKRDAEAYNVLQSEYAANRNRIESLLSSIKDGRLQSLRSELKKAKSANIKLERTSTKITKTFKVPNGDDTKILAFEIDANGLVENKDSSITLEENQMLMQLYPNVFEKLRDAVEEIKETKLLNEILDIHKSVLMNPSHDVQKLIFEPLAFGDLKDGRDVAKTINDARLRKKESKVFTPMSSDFQRDKLTAGLAGRLGTGSFSLDSVFAANAQPHKIQLLRTEVDSNGEPFQTPITVQFGTSHNTNGDISGVKTLNGQVSKTRLEVIAAFQSASVDNEKEQLLDKINANEFTFDAVRAMAMLGFDEGTIAAFLSQEIIFEYVEKVFNRQSDLMRASFNASDEVVQLLMRKRGLNPEMNAVPTKEDSSPEVYLKYFPQLDSFGYSELMDIIEGRTNVTPTEEIGILGKFLVLTAIGNQIKQIQQATTIDSSKIGKDYLTTYQKFERLQKVLTSKSFTNADKLFGKVYPVFAIHKKYGADKIREMQEQGFHIVGEWLIRPETIAGFATVYGLNTAYNWFSELFPYKALIEGDESILNKMSEIIGKNKDASSTTTIRRFEDYVDELKSFMFSSSVSGLFGDNDAAKLITLDNPRFYSDQLEDLKNGISLSSLIGESENESLNKTMVKLNDKGELMFKPAEYEQQYISGKDFVNGKFTQLPMPDQFVDYVYNEVNKIQKGYEQFKNAELNSKKQAVLYERTRSLQAYRKQLLIDEVKTKGKGKNKTQTVIRQSLASKIQEIKSNPNYDWVKSNAFLNRLNTEINKNGEASLVMYNAGVGENFDETNIYSAFLDLFNEKPLGDFNGQEYDTVMLAQDLIAYSYMTGGIQQAREFIKYIPVSYLRSMGFGNLAMFDLNRQINLQALTGYSPNNDGHFISQWIRNNPGLAPQLSSKDILRKKSDKTKTHRMMLIELTEEKLEKIGDDVQYVSVKNEAAASGYSLFKRVNSTQFQQIPTLGDGYVKEYDADFNGDEYVLSIFESNNLARDGKSVEIAPLTKAENKPIAERKIEEPKSTVVVKPIVVQQPKKVEENPIVSEFEKNRKMAIATVANSNSKRTTQVVVNWANDIVENMNLHREYLTFISNSSNEYIANIGRLMLKNIESLATIAAGRMKPNDAVDGAAISSDAIYINENSTSSEGKNRRQHEVIIMHEYIHIFTTSKIDEYLSADMNQLKPKLSAKEEKAMETLVKSFDEFRKLFPNETIQFIKDNYGTSELGKFLNQKSHDFNGGKLSGVYWEYAAANLKEFVTVFMQSPLLQKHFNSIQVEGKSLFQRFIDILFDFFGKLGIAESVQKNTQAAEIFRAIIELSGLDRTIQEEIAVKEKTEPKSAPIEDVVTNWTVDDLISQKYKEKTKLRMVINGKSTDVFIVNYYTTSDTNQHNVTYNLVSVKTDDNKKMNIIISSNKGTNDFGEKRKIMESFRVGYLTVQVEKPNAETKNIELESKPKPKFGGNKIRKDNDKPLDEQNLNDESFSVLATDYSNLLSSFDNESDRALFRKLTQGKDGESQIKIKCD